MLKQRSISVADLGFVGMLLTLLLAQHNDVATLDIAKDRVCLVVLEKNALAQSDKPLQLSVVTDTAEAFQSIDITL